MTYLVSPYSNTDPWVSTIRFHQACEFSAKLMPKLCEVFDAQGWKTIETFEKLPIGVIDNMRQLLKDYERWEADLVLCSEAWDTKDGLPKLTRELYDRLIQLQLRRNVLLANHKGA